MRCEEFPDVLAAAVADGRSLADCERHAADCPACRDLLAEQTLADRAIDLWRSRPAEPVLTASEEAALTDRIVASLPVRSTEHVERPQPKRSLARFGVPVAVAAVAAALFVAGLLWNAPPAAEPDPPGNVVAAVDRPAEPIVEEPVAASDAEPGRLTDTLRDWAPERPLVSLRDVRSGFASAWETLARNDNGPDEFAGLDLPDLGSVSLPDVRLPKSSGLSRGVRGSIGFFRGVLPAADSPSDSPRAG